MSDAKRTEADPYEVNALFDYIRAMVDSQWPSHEIAETLLLLGYVSPEQHRTEVEHWKLHAEEAGAGFARVCRDYARVAARNSELARALDQPDPT